MRKLLAISTFILSLATYGTAMAGDVYGAGEPEPVSLGTETEGFADIYSRQLLYRETANEFRERIYERQKDFQAPAIEARLSYKAALDKISDDRGNTN